MKICKVLLVSVSHCLNVCSHTRTRTVGGERERERERERENDDSSKTNGCIAQQISNET